MKQKLHANVVSIRNLDLASTLLSLHFKLRPEEPITLLIDENQRKTFTAHFLPETVHDVFGPLSAKTVLAILAGDPDARAKTRADLVELLDHMRAKEQNRNTLLDIIKPKEQGGRGLVTPRAIFKVGDWQASLPIDASPDLRR